MKCHEEALRQIADICQESIDNHASYETNPELRPEVDHRGRAWSADRDLMQTIASVMMTVMDVIGEDE